MPGAGLILGGFGLIDSLIKSGRAKKQERQFNRAIDNLGVLGPDQGIAENLAMAKNNANSISQVITTGKDVIARNMAGTAASIERNSTDASQALALLSATQGNADAAAVNLAVEAANDDQRRKGMLTQAYQLSAEDRGRVWADKLRQLNQKLGVKSVAYQNKNDATEGLFNSAGMIGTDILSMIQGNKGDGGSGGRNYGWF